MRNTRSGAAIMALATLLACQAQVEVTGDDAVEIAAVNAVRQMEVAAITSGDTTMASMADDIVVMPPSQPRYTASLTMTPAGATEATTERLKGVHIYRRGADGSWKMTLDVWNSDAPVRGAM
jgi:ketosteroid isomerase-like protein